MLKTAIKAITVKRLTFGELQASRFPFRKAPFQSLKQAISGRETGCFVSLYAYTVNQEKEVVVSCSFASIESFRSFVNMILQP